MSDLANYILCLVTFKQETYVSKWQPSWIWLILIIFTIRGTSIVEIKKYHVNIYAYIMIVNANNELPNDLCFFVKNDDGIDVRKPSFWTKKKKFHDFFSLNYF